MGSLLVACELLSAACGIEFPDQGSNLGPLHWECGVLATGPPGKSSEEIFKANVACGRFILIFGKTNTIM